MYIINIKGMYIIKIKGCQRPRGPEKVIEICVSHAIFHKTNEDTRPFARVGIDGIMVEGLLDSGANISCIGSDLATQINLDHFHKEFMPVRVSMADKSVHNLNTIYDIPYQFHGKIDVVQTIVLPKLGSNVILGMNFWNCFGITCAVHALEVDDVELHNTVTIAHQLTPEQERQLEAVKQFLLVTAPGKLNKSNVLEHEIDTGTANYRHILKRKSKRRSIE